MSKNRKISAASIAMGTLWVLIGVAAAATQAQAKDRPAVIRWTGAQDTDSSFDHVLEVLSGKTGHEWSLEDFRLVEDRDLAFNHYRRYVQLVEGVPVKGQTIRLWTDSRSARLIQLEASVSAEIEERILGMSGLKGSTSFWSLNTPSSMLSRLTAEKTSELARETVLKHADDANVRGIRWEDEWRDGDLVRAVEVTGKRGKHTVVIDARTRRVVAHEYREFPQAESLSAGTLSIPVQVYPIYEEPENASRQVLPRIAAELKNVLAARPDASGDIFAPIKARRYFYSQHDYVLGATPAGQAKGYWSMNVVRGKVNQILAGLPQVGNGFGDGLLLQGLYTTINIHPDALAKFGPWDFAAQPSSVFLPNWIESTNLQGRGDWEMIPSQPFSGKPLHSAADAWNRPARRLADHDPKAYLNDGFDEIQVYYAVDTLFEQLHARGFADPELSTRPFHAFLFNPDISMKDNAFYTDDTINFTTYSPKGQNFARDNSTIWHELGHGVMDRLMGEAIELADTGGLSEGMADFIAAMVTHAMTDGQPFPGSDKFRIINQIGFHLTNEVHDDGEAYGGAMKDFMDAVIARDGGKGLDKVVDATLEGMRLSRDYPGLTASEWFKHLLFADELGRPGVRAPGELGELLLKALAGRNFKLDGGDVARFSIVNTNGDYEVDADAPGSREKPIAVKIPKEGTASFALQAKVEGTDAFSFRFPVTVKVQYEGGPLEGAIDWVGEDKGPQLHTLQAESDLARIPLAVNGACDEVNRDDGSCVDYVYISVTNAGDTRPVAKKRFYLRVSN